MYIKIICKIYLNKKIQISIRIYTVIFDGKYYWYFRRKIILVFRRKYYWYFRRKLLLAWSAVIIIGIVGRRYYSVV